MAFSDVLDRGRALVVDAYNIFVSVVLSLDPRHDVWVTTSGHPCVYCQEMERISRLVNVPPGRPFPGPNMRIIHYQNAQQITFVNEPGEAHDNCQCVRVTVVAGQP